MLPQGGYRYPLLLLTATAAAAAHECVSVAGDEEGGLLCSDLALLGTNPHPLVRLLMCGSVLSVCSVLRG